MKKDDGDRFQIILTIVLKINSIIMYKCRLVNIVLLLSLVVILNSCTDNPTEPKPEPKQYIPVDTARRYDWTYKTGTFPTNDYYVLDTSNIYFATGGIAVKYDGIQFITLNMGDNRFYAQTVSPLSKECVFFGGEKRGENFDYIPVVKRYMNGIVDTYILPSDTNETIFCMFAVSQENFWAISRRGVAYYYNNGSIKVFDLIERSSGHFIYLTPEGRLLLFINSWYSATSKSVTTVKELINDNIIDISSDTLNFYDAKLIYQVGQDIITMREERNLYYFDGYHWVKFFNYYDLDPYFTSGFLAVGGKSRNEFMFIASTMGYPLLLKDNKWTCEFFYNFGPGGNTHPRVFFYDDRIYFITQNYQAYITHLYKGKLKINKFKTKR